MNWVIAKIIQIRNPDTPSLASWQVNIKDTLGTAFAAWIYIWDITAGPTFTELSAQLVAAGYCPGDFGACP